MPGHSVLWKVLIVAGHDAVDMWRPSSSPDDADAVAALPGGVYALYYTAVPSGVELRGGQLPTELTIRAKATLVVLPAEGLEGDPRHPGQPAPGWRGRGLISERWRGGRGGPPLRPLGREPAPGERDHAVP